MSSIKSDNFDELCRLCASYDAIKMDIFGDRGRERKLLEKIHTCLPFHVSEEDSLPKSLCYRCIYNLENFYDFRKGCVEAVSRLEHFVSEADLISDSKKIMFHDGPSDDNNSVISIHSDYSESQEPNPADFLEARMDNEIILNSRSDMCEQIIEVNAGSFACPACPKSFSNMSALILHSKLHMGGGSASAAEKKEQRLFPCEVCGKSFISKGNLSNHVKTHSYEPNTISRLPRDTNAVRPFQCELCSKTYVVAKHLWGHVNTSHRGDPRVTCPYCSRTFSTQANLAEHKTTKHLHEIKRTMREVDENTNVDSASNDNESQDSAEAVGKDEFCSSRRKNTKPRKIAREYSNDTDMGNSFSFADTEEESRSSDVVHKSCLLCGKTFSNRSGLRRHLFNVHGLDPNEVEAQRIETPDTIVKKEIDDNDMVESLLEAETVFCCEVCVREFNDRASLWLHMLYSHREEAATACGICLRVCSDNISLSEHIHSCHPRESLGTEKRRYSCQVCARQHDSRKKLITHVKIHNLQDEEGNSRDPETMVMLNNDLYFGHSRLDDDFTLRCEICFKCFPTETKLMKHKRNAHKDSQKMHSLNSSDSYHSYFSCELCGLSHSTRTERWKHVFRCHSDEPSLVCEVPTCGKVFPTSALKIEHDNSHHQQQGDMPNTCEICGNLWATRMNFWKHMMGVHRDTLPFVCGVCLKIFVSIPDLASHVQEKHNTKDSIEFCCDICGRPYTKKSKMSRHRKIHNIPFSEGGLQEGQFESQVKGCRSDYSSVQLKCEDCPSEEFLDLEELSEHRRSAHNLAPCDLCPKFYGRTSHLWKHVNKIHKGHTDITCSMCLRTSASRIHLYKHIAKHHRAVTGDTSISQAYMSNNTSEDSVHTCLKCSKVFRKDHLMHQHMKHCTGPRSAPIVNSSTTVNGTFPCDKCSKVCDNRGSLYKHIKNSHVTYNCEVCEEESKKEVFDSKTKLFDHILQNHLNHPDLTCDVPNCFKMLRVKKDLFKHRREHRQGYPTPSCDFCGELITNRIKLRKHLKSNHPQQSKWICYACSAVEHSYEDLGVHIKETHPLLIGKPNICAICAKRCPTKHKLLAHLKIHGEEFFACDICFSVYRNKDELETHRKHHLDEDEDDDEEEIEESKIGIKRENSNEEGNETKKVKRDFEYFKPCVMIPNKSVLEGNLNSSTALNTYSSPNKHRKVYEGDDGNCICELCGKVWASKKQFWQHLIRSHSTDAATACGVCLKLCSNYINLDMHIMNKHPNNFEGEVNHLNCRICGKFQPYYTKLMNHIVIHVGEEKRAQNLIFACYVCGTIFESQSELCQHHEENHKKMILPDDDDDDLEDDDENSENLHHCDICEEILEGIDAFLEHSKKHHVNHQSSFLSEANNSTQSYEDEEHLNPTRDEEDFKMQIENITYKNYVTDNGESENSKGSVSNQDLLTNNTDLLIVKNELNNYTYSEDSTVVSDSKTVQSVESDFEHFVPDNEDTNTVSQEVSNVNSLNQNTDMERRQISERDVGVMNV